MSDFVRKLRTLLVLARKGRPYGGTSHVPFLGRGPRAMKVSEVILRAIDGRVKRYQAAESQGISDDYVAFIRLIPQINPKRAPSVHDMFSTNQSR